MVQFIKGILVCALACIAWIMSSCAVTTKSSEGTTETFHNTTDASSELTSSTSPRGDGKDARVRKINAFTVANIQRLQEDMARGGGEHLASFAYLLGIDTSNRPEFYAFTKEKYPVLFRNPVNPAELLARLDTELDAYPQWQR